MRIAFDATAIPKEKAGAGKYVINLLLHLSIVDKQNSYYIFVQSDDVESFKFDNPNFHLLPVDSKIIRKVTLRLLWEQLVLPFKLKNIDADCLHSPHYSVPLFSPVPVVVNFHDMAFFLFPNLYTLSKRILFPLYMRMAAKKAKKILVISESTARDVMRILKVRREKLEVTLIGRENDYIPIGDKQAIEEVKKKFGIEGNYILFVGTLEPRKNVLSMVKAFAEIQQSSHRNIQLVIVGKRGWLYNDVLDYLASTNIQNVIMTGYVDSVDLPYLYNGAEFFVYPSLYEGFGIPVLEALACGVPTITSNVSSLPEVIGNAGLTVNPNNVNELKSAMEKLLNDLDLRQEMQERSLIQAEKFSWDTCAMETINIYKTVASNK